MIISKSNLKNLLLYKRKNMYQNIAKDKSFSGLFVRLEESLNGQKTKSFHQIRKKAIAILENLKFPDRTDENWKYTSVKPILDLDFQVVPETEFKDSRITFSNSLRIEIVNGIPQGDLNHRAFALEGGIEMMTIENAMEDPRFSRRLAAEADQTMENKTAFSVLNQAFHRGGIFIYVPKNAESNQLIHLAHISGGFLNSAIIATQLIVMVEEGGHTEILESFENQAYPQQDYFINVLNRYFLEQNARLTHYKIQAESDKAFQITHSTAYQKRDSVFTSHVVDAGGKVVRNNLNAILEGSGTNSNLFGVYFSNEDRHIDNQTFIDHALPHCESNELYKGILTDRGRGVFNGKVMVRQDAQKTNAYQQNSSLVLSDFASMNTKPQLEIFADDVKCSHGATIGQLSQESIFYLKSRGIPEAEARKLLQRAFIGEVLDKMENEEIREFAENLIG